MNKLTTPEEFEKEGISNIIVTYADGSNKEFDIYNWCIFREGILKMNVTVKYK